MDFINRILQVLKADLYQLRISVWDTGLIKLVKLQDKGQLSHITEFSTYICENVGPDIPTFPYTQTFTIGRRWIYKELSPYL